MDKEKRKLRICFAASSGGHFEQLMMLRPLMELLTRAAEMGGVSPAVLLPVIKSVGIGICSRVAADLCKDSGQGAMAQCVELAGTVCALYTALPLMESLLDMLETLI